MLIEKKLNGSGGGSPPKDTLIVDFTEEMERELVTKKAR